MDFNKLIARVKGILLTPKTEWPVIAGEQTTVADLYKGYILWLAAIPPVFTFLKFSRDRRQRAVRWHVPRRHRRRLDAAGPDAMCCRSRCSTSWR